ncbi:lasso peptide biosynthesis PqqD family chaperone [Rubrivivax gelatinosus]|uniref:Coenzyme PQQ synthesis protein D (PqqD) n=1 Tax=Rubrivivax gelatinosus TaxID=28068 RepID=A0ABS1DWU1_RUBGE|nr:lasso peptide biosynthesis PqqD family chaperone [Rubrivivax gelatinosus]MBK1714516.1 hypothetical protein [Rubrivivax gelatinosus]
MSTLTLQHRVVRQPGLVATPMDGETVMMSIDNGEYYGLAGAGSRTWELLAEPQTLDQLCATLTAEHEVDPATCQAETLRFVGELLALGLVKTC